MTDEQTIHACAESAPCTHIFDPLTAVLDADGREICPVCFEIGNLRKRVEELERDLAEMTKIAHAMSVGYTNAIAYLAEVIPGLKKAVPSTASWRGGTGSQSDGLVNRMG